MKKLLSTMMIAAVGGLSAIGVYKAVEKPLEETRTILNNQAPVKMVNMPLYAPESAVDFTKAAELTVHSVVHVKTEYSPQGNQFYNDPFHQFFFGPAPKMEPQQGSGSGVIISENGYVVTNNHVIDKAEKIQVVLNNRKTYNAELVGKDPTTDLAILRIEEKGLPFINFGNSDNVKVGEWVLAVGNPFNLTSTVTAGIVSAKGRNINILENDPSRGLFPIESFIQTDAAVNPGNSGGALVNTNGELIGINSAIASNTGSYTGYSFAIPVNIVKKVTNDLLEYGAVQRAFLGVSIRDIDSKLAEEKGIKEFRGVYVSGLSEGGAAKEAGIKEGDIIVKVGETTINTAPELTEQVGRFRPGEKVLVDIIRGGKEKEIEVVLKNKNGNTDVIRKDKVEIVKALGATFEPLSNQDRNKLGIESGVKVGGLEAGKLKGAGIREGFIITHIDKKPVSSPDDINNVLKEKKGGVLIEGIYPNGLRAYYGFGL